MGILLVYQSSSHMLSKSCVIYSRARSYEFILFLFLISFIIFNELLSILHSSIDLLFRDWRIVISRSWISHLICWHIKHFLSLLKPILFSCTMLRHLILMRSWSNVLCWKRLSDWFIKLCPNLVLWFIRFNFVCTRTRIFDLSWLKIAFI